MYLVELNNSNTSSTSALRCVSLLAHPLLLFLRLSGCCPVTAHRLHPAILLVLIRAWLTSKRPHLPFLPINIKFTEPAFLPRTELGSQGWMVSPGCVWREQTTSHPAANSNLMPATPLQHNQINEVLNAKIRISTSHEIFPSGSK